MSFRVANVVRRVSQATRRLTTDGTASVIGVNLSATKHPAALHNALSLQNASRSEVRQARKQEIIRKYSRCEGDTGSAEVQIAVLSDRIADLTRHVVANKKDVQTKRSLVIVVQQRRKLMKYLLRKDADRYMTVVKRLGLRPNSVFSKDRPLGAKKAATLDLSEK